jgi:uncharacterized membrane protein
MSKRLHVSKELAISIVVVVVAAALRFYRLGDNSLWLDEAVYANNAFNTFADFLHLTRSNNSTPIALPLLYWLCGEILWDPLLIRIFPAFFGTAAVVVVLKMSQVGVSRAVTLPAALWLALSPLQVEYSQEVREYSLSVLVSSLLLYGFLQSVSEERGKASVKVFVVMLGIAPLCSYGNVIIGGALIILYALVSLLGRRVRIRDFFLLCASFCLSLCFSYILTARYQIGVAQAQYLQGYYPVGTFGEVLRWLTKSTLNYLRMGNGIPRSSSFLVLLTSIYGLLLLKRGSGRKPEAQVVWALLLLIAISWALAFLKLYPFGEMRQHLFATPLITIASTAALLGLAASLRVPERWFVATMLVALPLIFAKKLPRAYAEHQDIRSAVNANSPDTDDRSVFIYFASIPAVSFHYPSRAFYRSKTTEGEVEVMSGEVDALQGCRKALVFSHILKGDGEAVVKNVVARGYRIVNRKKCKGALLVEVSKCGVGEGKSPVER